MVVLKLVPYLDFLMAELMGRHYFLSSVSAIMKYSACWKDETFHSISWESERM